MKKVEEIKKFLSTKSGKKISVVGIVLVMTLILYLPFSLASLEPTKSIIITSKNTSYENKEAGSWQVEKSSTWTSKGKAQVTFDVDTILKTNNKYTDIIMVLDISGSMSGDKLNRVKSDTTELIQTILSNSKNKMALITFDSTSSIVSDLTNEKDLLLEKVNALTDTGSTNYYQALVNVDTILKDYQKEEDRELIVLFLTDGYPNIDTPNEETQYKYLKDRYPYITMNGIQYEMGSNILDPIKKISDQQFIANMETLNNVLFEASVSPVAYEQYEIIDYIDNHYFTLESKDNITVSEGTVKLEEENGKQKVTWTIDHLKSGSKAKLTMDIKLKEEYIGQGGIYPTNEKEQVISKIEDQEENITSTKTPILADNYQVIYDGNAPEGCSVKNIPNTNNYSVFDTVEISGDKPSCEGYQFKGWKIANKEVTKVNDDYFIMPESDVTIRAEWSKLKLAKSMDGTISKVQTLYKIMQDQAVMDNEKSEFVSSSTGIDFAKAPSNTNGKGVYTRAGTEQEKYPIYYYRGIIDNNHVKFAGFCWKAVRTTETGGVKLIYDGVPDSNGVCNNTGTDSQIGTSAFNSSYQSPADVGYMTGTRYTYSNIGMGETFWYSFVGKTRPSKSGMSSTNYYYGDSVTYSDGQYILTNPTQSAWSDTYSSLKGKYTCLSETEITCSEVDYVDSTNSSTMYYVKMANGETYESLVEQAKQPTWVYGNDVTWNGTNYTLIDTVESKPMDWATDRTSKVQAGHRYTCLSASNTCSTVYYTHYTGNATYIYYMTLKEGKNINDALDEMFPEDNNLRNQNNSTIKTKIDTWYQENMTDYTKYLEDTVWCNDRSIYQKNSWDKDYNGTGSLLFGAYANNVSTKKPTTSCPNTNDSFTVSSEIGNGKLTYPVALLTADELTMAGHGWNGYSKDAYLSTGQYWWSLSPYYFSNNFASGFLMDSSGTLYYNGVSSSFGVRPSVSLAPGIMISEGDGTSENPYRLELEE